MSTPYRIGIRDLKNRVPQVVREVRETGEPVEITYHGEVVAIITPAAIKATADYKNAWKALDDVVAEIGKRTRAAGKRKRKAAGWRRDL